MDIKYSCQHEHSEQDQPVEINVSPYPLIPIDGKIRWHIDERYLTKDVDKYKVIYAFEQAFKLWQEHFYPLQIEATGNISEAPIVIRFGNNGESHLPEQFDRGVLAYAYFPYRQSLGYHSDIYFNDQENWAEMHKFGHVNLKKVAVHEIGHSLGLDHSDYRQDVMFWQYMPNNSIVVTSDTAEGIKKLYRDYLITPPPMPPEADEGALRARLAELQQELTKELQEQQNIQTKLGEYERQLTASQQQVAAYETEITEIEQALAGIDRDPVELVDFATAFIYASRRVSDNIVRLEMGSTNKEFFFDGDMSKQDFQTALQSAASDLLAENGVSGEVNAHVHLFEYQNSVLRLVAALHVNDPSGSAPLLRFRLTLGTFSYAVPAYRNMFRTPLVFSNFFSEFLVYLKQAKHIDQLILSGTTFTQAQMEQVAEELLTKKPGSRLYFNRTQLPAIPWQQKFRSRGWNYVRF